MKQNLKIAIYSGNIPSTTFIENLIEGLSECGLTIFLFGKQKHKVSYTNSKNVKMYALPSNRIISFFKTVSRSLTLLIKHPKRFVVVWRNIDNYPSRYQKWIWWSRYVPVVLHLPDVFHVQWAKDLDRWLFLKSNFGTKIVLSLLGSHINYSPKVDEDLALSYKANFPKVDAFHGVSEAIIKEAQYYNASPKKCRLIYTQIKPSTFQHFADHHVSKIKKIQILSVGRHHWVKGYDYAIDAMRILKKEGIDFEYSIIAQGQIPESLLFKVKEYDLISEVKFISGISQKHLFQNMKSYDVLLLPSLNEGIANVVVEAMAVGLLVVSTNCGGMPEIVKPNETGWLCEIRNPESIAKTLMTVIQTPYEKRIQIAENAYHLVKQHFSAPNIMKEFIDLYNSILHD